MESPRSPSPAGERATATASQDRVEWYLDRAGIRRPPTIGILEKPRTRDFQPELPVHRDAAQALLEKQRASDNDAASSRAAWLPKRSAFGARKQKESKPSGENSPFTRYHVAQALDELLSSNPLPPVGMAQALLSQTSTITLEELWRELHVQHDSESKKTLASRTVPEMTWLDTVVCQQDMDYVHLMCQSTVDQETLDRAFGIALSHSSTAIMRLLLSFGASATSHLETIREQYRRSNIDLLALLLSAPKSLTTADWLRCLLPEPITSTAPERSVKDPEVFLLDALSVCVAHRPDLAHELPLLLETLRRQDLKATAIVLAYAEYPRGAFSGIRKQVFELACCVHDPERRLALFDLLAKSNLLVDDPVTREALASSVQTNQLARAKLLIDAGVSVDIPPHDILQHAVSQLSFSALELFRNATLSSPASLVLTYVPDSASEMDMVHLMEVFGPKGIAGESLDSRLVHAVRKGQLRLVRMLLRCGASVEFDRGAAIRTALEKSDIDAFDILLRHDCSREFLSAAIPEAMALVSRAKRLRAMGALTEKGADHDTLGMPLQGLVAEAGDTDMTLVRLLLRHRAPVDLSDDPERNPVLVAAKRGDVPLLRMLLCRAKPRPQQKTLSAAVPIAFSGIETAGYEVVLSMLTMLLQRGAIGQPIDETLAKAAALGDAGLDIVRVLLAHRADANSADGLSYVRAVEGGNPEMLGVLFTSCPPGKPGLRSALQTAIDPRYYSLKTLDFLLSAARPSVVSSVLNGEEPRALGARLDGHPNAAEIILCLFRHGLDVNQSKGHILGLAVRSKDIDLLRTLLSSNPNDASLATALASATRVEPPKIRHLMWELIFEKAASSDIGQSTWLAQEIPTALKGNMTGVHLLLRHGAKVNFGRALAVRDAAAAGSLPVLGLLLSGGGDDAASVSTHDQAFLAASASSIAVETKEAIFSYLLATEAGVSAHAISKALTESVTTHPDDTQLPRILLTQGAIADFHALKAVLSSASSDLFEMLAESITDASMANDMFRRFRRLMHLDADKRYRAYSCLLAKGADDKHNISTALADSLMAGPDHISIAQLLHDHGASLNSWNCSAVTTEVIKTRDFGAIRFLGEHLVSRGDDGRVTAHSMFSRLHRDQDIDLDMRLEIYKALLPCKLKDWDLHNALVASVQGPHRSTDVVRLLLAHGANPNLKNKASCFLIARENNAEAEFRLLCEHGDLGVVLPALLDGDADDESSLSPWIRWCLEAQPQSAKGPGPHHDAVFQCMRRFPEGTEVLDILLDHGVGPSAKKDCFFRDYWEWEGEECTALMWALVSEKPRVSNKTILRLVARGDTGMCLLS
jgi:ankyrin repeat protein